MASVVRWSRRSTCWVSMRKRRENGLLNRRLGQKLPNPNRWAWSVVSAHLGTDVASLETNCRRRHRTVDRCVDVCQERASGHKRGHAAGHLRNLITSRPDPIPLHPSRPHFLFTVSHPTVHHSKTKKQKYLSMLYKAVLLGERYAPVPTEKERKDKVTGCETPVAGNQGPWPRGPRVGTETPRTQHQNTKTRLGSLTSSTATLVDPSRNCKDKFT